MYILHPLLHLPGTLKVRGSIHQEMVRQVEFCVQLLTQSETLVNQCRNLGHSFSPHFCPVVNSVLG